MGRLESGAEKRSSLPNLLLTTRSPFHCQNPPAPLLGHTLLCSSLGAGQSLTSGAFRCCLASFWAEGLWWGSGDGPRGVSQMLPDGSLLKNRVGTFTPSHSLASLAGTGDRTPCPHHLLPLPSRLQSGWELGRLATGAEEAIWRAQSPHTLVSYSVSSLPPIAHPSLWLALRSSTHTLPSLPTRQHPSGLHHCRGVGQACLLPAALGLSQPPRHPRTP